MKRWSSPFYLSFTKGSQAIICTSLCNHFNPHNIITPSLFCAFLHSALLKCIFSSNKRSAQSKQVDAERQSRQKIKCGKRDEERERQRERECFVRHFNYRAGGVCEQVCERYPALCVFTRGLESQFTCLWCDSCHWTPLCCYTSSTFDDTHALK